MHIFYEPHQVLKLCIIHVQGCAFTWYIVLHKCSNILILTCEFNDQNTRNVFAPKICIETQIFVYMKIFNRILKAHLENELICKIKLLTHQKRTRNSTTWFCAWRGANWTSWTLEGLGLLTTWCMYESMSWDMV
jgi:hypothetical protein